MKRLAYLIAAFALTYALTSCSITTRDGTNVTLTNRWALGAESARFGTSNQVTISTGGILSATNATLTTPTITQINGGTAANDDLILQGTTNATRTTSYVVLQPNGGFVGIGVSAPVIPLHIVANNSAAGMFRAQNTNAGGYCGFELVNDAGTQIAAFGTGNSGASFYPNQMYVGTTSNNGVNFLANSSVRMFIASTGEVGIGTISPSTRAMLELSSTTKGFLPPRMTTTQRDAITSPPAGLMIYNTSTNKLNVFTTTWEAVTSA